MSSDISHLTFENLDESRCVPREKAFAARTISDKREILLTDEAATSSWRPRWLLTVLRSIPLAHPLAGHGAVSASLSVVHREVSS